MNKLPEFYSQNGEDILLARCFTNRNQGFYIDVGAQDEEVDSVTKHFYDRGWSGINIEPVQEYASTFSVRLRDTTICCAAGSHGELRDMLVSVNSGQSTFDHSSASHIEEQGFKHEVRRIEIRTLNEILNGLGHRELKFDFLKIDVEGFEHEVIQGINLHIYRPTIILCEVTLPDSIKTNLNYPELCAAIGAFDYRPVYFDGLNQWWIAEESYHEFAAFFTTPIGIFDGVSPYERLQLKRGHAQARQALAQAWQELAQARQELAQARNEAEAIRSREEALMTKLHSMETSRTWRLSRKLKAFAQAQIQRSR
jgi:FkbM family methyltransferase